MKKYTHNELKLIRKLNKSVLGYLPFAVAVDELGIDDDILKIVVHKLRKLNIVDIEMYDGSFNIIKGEDFDRVVELNKTSIYEKKIVKFIIWLGLLVITTIVGIIISGLLDFQTIKDFVLDLFNNIKG